MYRGASPIFDVPEFQALRRVKPLPKRRRTVPSPNVAIGRISTASGVTISHRTTTASLGIGLGLAMGLGLPGSDPTATTAEELLAHADSISALQSYYMPLIGGVQDLFRTEIEAQAGRGTTTTTTTTLDFTAIAGFAVGTSAGTLHHSQQLQQQLQQLQQQQQQQQQRFQDDEDQDDDDYVDHLQQPGNTKKRKVPTKMSGSPSRRDGGSQSGGEDESTERSVPGGRSEKEKDHLESLTPAFASAAALLGSGSTGAIGLAAGILSTRKGKITPATLAGLQHKEMLKNRKRQLVAVLGALSHGDALALDQALSASLPFVTAGFGDLRGTGPPKVRLSRRKGPRQARAVRILAKSALARHPDAIAFPTCEFTFVYPSATSDRLVATKEEVTQLRNRFEAELARQATKAAKLAAASKLMAAFPTKANRAKRAERTQRGTRTTGTKGEGNENVDPSGRAEAAAASATGKPRGKKKKRSAWANAANPHHLKNYVPSRLPHSGQTTAPTTGPVNVHSQSFLGPPPLRFLSAEIPPRRRKKPVVTPTAVTTNPTDEWLCPLCDYRLFYGDAQEYRRSVKMRKKILRRRRRARERAAAAASGSKLADRNSPSQGEYEEEGGYEPAPGGIPKLVKSNVIRGGGGEHYGSFG